MNNMTKTGKCLEAVDNKKMVKCNSKFQSENVGSGLEFSRTETTESEKRGTKGLEIRIRKGG